MSDENKTLIESADGGFRGEYEVGEHGILFAALQGVQDEEAALECVEVVRRYAEHAGGRKIMHCLDFTRFDDSDPGGRRVIKEHLLAADSPVERLAFFGGGFFQRTLVNLYSRLSKVQMRYCKTREEAVEWLTGGGNP